MERDLIKKSFSEKIAFKLAYKINNEYEEDNLNFIKMKYGLEVLIINLSKTLLILTMAEFLGIVTETLFIMLSFAFIRCYAFGVHSKSSAGCTLVTSICFLLEHIYQNFLL